ncbi:MAG TPA: Ig-like domain-containing protein [Iamia sp.]|nr:Ig-like domain-containing protein [Iamia sp.]
MGRRGSHLARIGAVIGLAALVAGVHPAPAGAAPAFGTPPTRLYTLVDAPIAFTGSDAISGQDRALVVSGSADDSGCAPAAGNSWDLTDCVSLDLDVSHGEVSIPMETTLGGAGEPLGTVQGGAILSSSTDGDSTAPSVDIDGTEQQINDALAVLTYTPTSGYEYDGSNGETLALVANDDTGSTNHSIEIRVQSTNDWPELTVPSNEIAVPAGGSVDEPVVEPPLADLGTHFVEDVDIDEGEMDQELLLVMFATCGEFSLRGSLPIADDIENLLLATGLDQLAVDALVALLPSEVTSQPFATGNALDPHVAIAGIGSITEVNYALGQVTFDAPATDGTCDLWTIVSDLGNNGLPFQYVGSPPTGFEIPAFGVDFDITSFVVGEGVELTLPTNLSIAEGSTLPIPVATSSAMHPAIDLTVGAADVSATGGTDYTPPAATATFPENDAGPLNIDLATLGDPDDEIDETLTVTVGLSGMPPGVTLANDTVTVTITDDDAPVPDTTDPTVTIDQGGTQADPTSMAPIVFDVEFSEPVTGFDGSDVDLTASTAGGTLAASVTGSGSGYTVEVSGMTTGGTVIATIPVGAAMDAATNPNEASTSSDNTVTWVQVVDTTDPTVTIDQAGTQADPTSMAPITFDVEFSEPVTGFDGSDVDLTASTAGGLLIIGVTGSGSTYEVEVTGMTTDGGVTATIPVGAAMDAATNPNEASTSTDNTVTWVQPVVPDQTAPTVTVDQAVGQADPTFVSPILFTVVFDEPVTGFDDTDPSFAGSTVGGTLTATITGAGPTYDVAVTGMTTDGDVVLTVPAGGVTDLASNPNEASTSTDNIVAWQLPDPGDTTSPTVTVEQADGQADPTSVAPVRFVATFSEPVTGFDVDDLRLDGSTVGGTILGDVTTRSKADGTSFDIVLSGMTSAGDLVVSVVAGAATDTAGNPSTASTSLDNVVSWTEVDVDDGSIDDPYAPYTDDYYYDGYGGTSYGSDDGYLARTGLDLAGVLVVGVGVVGLGLGLVLVARRPWGLTG